tara:strand:+ start:798 stop:923 length:126 start_codon:yes stop_codon:yes gene_type:complete
LNQYTVKISATLKVASENICLLTMADIMAIKNRENNKLVMM